MSSNTPPSPSKNNAAAPNAEGEHKVSNFLRQVIEKDLGALIAKLPPESKLFRAAADVVCKLHPRGKSNEQQRLGTRDVTEADGSFAIEALGFVLRELGWAR